MMRASSKMLTPAASASVANVWRSWYGPRRRSPVQVRGPILLEGGIADNRGRGCGAVAGREVVAERCSATSIVSEAEVVGREHAAAVVEDVRRARQEAVLDQLLHRLGRFRSR